MTVQKLQITTPGPQNHTHIVYLNEDTGVSGCSPSNLDGHTHELIWSPARPPTDAVPPQTDPQTGQPMIDPNTGQPDQGTPADPGQEEGIWIVQPAATADGEVHTHELTDIVPVETKTTETPEQIMADCNQLWRDALALTKDSRESGRESEKYYKGEQWENNAKNKLNSLDRPALTINEIAPNIDTLLGYQMENRTDIRYLPQEDGDQRVADMLNVIVKKITDQCAFPREESKVFRNVCIPGFGAFNVFMSFKNNPEGDAMIESFPWDDIVYGPFEKEDLSDCEYEHRSRMYSLANLKMLFGEKANELDASFRMYSGQYPDSDEGSNGISGTNTDYRLAKKIDDVPYMMEGEYKLVDVYKKQFRLCQCTRKIYKKTTVIFNENENYFFTAYDWKDEDIKAATQIPGFQSLTQMKERFRITKYCAGVLLADENPADLPRNDFFTVPVFAYRQNGEYWGKVEIAKDPQRELNKRRSQMMDTLNRLGGSIYYTDPEMFKTPAEMEKFKKNRSRPGSVFEVQNANRVPVLEKGAELPASLVQIMEMDQQNLQRLMNVMSQQDGANESNALFQEKKKAKLTGNQFLMDNLSFAKQKLGLLLLSLIQRYYTTDRLYRLLSSANTKNPFQIGGADFSSFSKDEIQQMLEDADLSTYDVIVSESSFAPSTRMAIAQMIFQAMQNGMQFPPEVPFKFIDMPADIRKDITDSLEQQSQQSVQDATNTSNAEIIKTLIAKGQYTVTPDKAQELGLVPAGPDSRLANPETLSNNGNNPQATEVPTATANQSSPLAG